MRYKSRYSLNLKSSLKMGGKTQENSIYEQRVENTISVGSLLKKLDNSLDVFSAFGNYLVERAVTREMQERFDAACKYIENENQEVLKQYSILEMEHGKRLIKEIEYLKIKYETQAKEIEKTTRNLADSLSERSKIEKKTRVTPLIKTIKLYLNYLEEKKNIIDIIADSEDDFVKKNYWYYQLNDEYIKDFSIMQKYLKSLIAEQEA